MSRDLSRANVGRASAFPDQHVDSPAWTDEAMWPGESVFIRECTRPQGRQVHSRANMDSFARQASPLHTCTRGGIRLPRAAFSVLCLAPRYLASHCKPTSTCPGRSHLRSATSGQLNFSHTKLTMGREASLSMDQLSGTAYLLNFGHLSDLTSCWTFSKPN